MNAAVFQLQAAHLALQTLAAVVAERTGNPPAALDRRSLDIYISRWQDKGLGDFRPYGDRRSKAEVVEAFDEAIARLERSLNGDPNETGGGE